MDRRTAGVTGMPPLSPCGELGWGNRETEGGGRGCLAVAADDEDDEAICVRPGVTVDDVEDMPKTERRDDGR